MKALLAISVSLLLIPALAEDTKPATQMGTLTSRSELVLVPALVRDKSGKPVTGLSWNDFTLLEDGAERKIAVFEELTTSTSRPRRQASPAGEFSNYLANDPSPSRLTIIVMDSINTEFSDRAYAHDEILKFLKETAGSDEPIALLQLDRGGMNVIHDFTTDPAVLAKALRGLQLGAAPVAEHEQSLPAASALAFARSNENAQVARETQRLVMMLQDMENNYLADQQMLAVQLTLDGLQQIARAYGALPGRKSLIWASGGFPFSIDDLSRFFSDGTEPSSGTIAPTRNYLSDIVPRYENTWQALNNANIALYPVDVRGLVGLGPGVQTHVSASSLRAAGRRAGLTRLDTLATFREFASMTGGKAYVNTNDLAHAFHDAIDDSASYYMLGFYLAPDDRKPGWHRLQVRVKREHSQVRSRSGFYVMPENKDKNRARLSDIELAMNSPLDFTSLPVLARWTETMHNGQKTRTAFELILPANSAMVDESDHNHLSLDFQVAAREPTGNVVASNSRTLEAHLKPQTVARIRSSGITYKGALELPPGEYSVRFVVRDNLSGHLGSVAAPLKVP